MHRRPKAKRLALIAVGSLLSSLSVAFFLAPSGLLSGGISGVGLILFYTFGVPVSAVVALLNIPIMIVGFKHLHYLYMIRSLVGVAAFALLLALWQSLVPEPAPLVDDVFLNALFGGILSGTGFGLMFRGRGSAGGTDVLSLILNRRLSVGLGTLTFAFNAVPLLAGVFLIDVRLLGYTLMSLYVAALVIDRIQVGLFRSKTVMIVSGKYELMTEQIISRVRRGVTLLHGEGGFTHGPKTVILTTVSLPQLTKLKEVVGEVDPEAFMTVSDASEVLGRGFGAVMEEESR